MKKIIILSIFLFTNNLISQENYNSKSLILKLNSDTSYVDSCDVNPKRFGKEISKLSNNKKIQ
jgi:hypothetical protein